MLVELFLSYIYFYQSFTGIYMILAAVLMIATFLVCFFKMLPFQKKQQSLIKVKNKLKINLETGNNKEKLTVNKLIFLTISLYVLY